MGEKFKTEEEENQNQEQEQSNVNFHVPISDIKPKVLIPLGRGAKGVVFRARVGDSSSGEDVALKVVLRSSIRSKGEKQSNWSEKDRVSFEQEVLRELDHPLLPRLKGVFETEEVVGYGIDYCPGRDLNSLRKQQVEKMFSDDIIRFYGAELVLALEYLHKKGIVYRDLKPENVLIQENGHLMLVDFDLSTKLVPKSFKNRPSYEPVKTPESKRKKKSKSHLPKFHLFCNSGISPEDSVNSANAANSAADSAAAESYSDTVVAKSNSFVGTEDYVAPEIIQGKGHDFAVDWWSYGVVLYEMLYGTTPFRGANRKETFHRILSKTPELVGETTPLRDLIKKLLEKDPKQRISVQEIKGHDFFRGVDWDLIVRISRPPFLPGRPDLEEGVEGIKGGDLESFVSGILNKNKNKNKNGSKNKNSIDNNKNSDNKECENSDSNKEYENSDNNNSSNKIDEESMNRGVWVEGLNQPSMSGNFLVF